MRRQVFHILGRGSCSGHTDIRQYVARRYPWSIEFNEDVLGVVEDDGVVVVCHDNGDGALLSFGDGFALDAGFHGAVEETINKLLNVRSGDFLGLIEWEFLVLLKVLNRKRRPGLLPTRSGRKHMG